MIETKPSRSPIRWIPSTWFAMGLPFVAIANASSLMYKGLGVSDGIIAFWTSLILLPWTLKPLWGPFMEMYRTKKFFVVVTQLLSGALFMLVGLSLQLPAWFAASIALLGLTAFSAASHDIAADGIYITELNPKQQAKFVGWQGAFYNVAKIVSGGVLVSAAGYLEKVYGVAQAWSIIMAVYGLIMILLGLYNKLALPTGVQHTQVESKAAALRTLGDVLVTFFQKKYIWFSLAFIVFYRFAEGQAIKITPLFLKATRAEGGLALTTSEIGLLQGVFGSAAFVAGSIASGYFVSNRGLNRKTLMWLCAIFNLPFAAYAYLATALPTNLYVIGFAMSLEYFGYGFGFVGLILFIMQNIAPGKYKMAHYAFASGLMNLGFMLPSMVSGWVSEYLGYKDFFIWVMMATVPAFVVSWLVPLRPAETLEQPLANDAVTANMVDTKND